MATRDSLRQLFNSDFIYWFMNPSCLIMSIGNMHGIAWLEIHLKVPWEIMMFRDEFARSYPAVIPNWESPQSQRYPFRVGVDSKTPHGF